MLEGGAAGPGIEGGGAECMAGRGRGSRLQARQYVAGEESEG